MEYNGLIRVGTTSQRGLGGYSPNNTSNPARGEERPSLFNYTQVVTDYLPRPGITSGAIVHLPPVNEQPKEKKHKAQKDTPLRDRLTIIQVTRLRKVRKTEETTDLMERKLNQACLKMDKFKKDLIRPC